MELRDAIARVIAGTDFSQDEIAAVFARIMEGQATAAQIGALLVGLRIKGETPDEIAGAARAMREKATVLRCADPESAVDTCGTGGDGSGSVNVSTLAAIVVAGAGVCVAKHGNRALSSRAGSADVLDALGVNISAPIDVLEACLREVNIAFMFAPAFHAATKHAAGPRKELGTRTVFNLLGPLTNPAGVKNQIVGVFAAAWCKPVAEALGMLGARHAFVVHGEGGLDEVAVAGKTQVAVWRRDVGHVQTREISPGDFGLQDADPDGLRGGDAQENAAILREVLAGKAGSVRNAAIMEAALALSAVAGNDEFVTAAKRAAGAIDSGAALETLDAWAKLSHSGV